MRKFSKRISFLCGLLLTLAAFPVFAQNQPVEPNKKPLRDFGEIVSSKIKKKEVDLTKPFLIELCGTLNQEGKFDKQKTRFVRAEGDEQMIELVKSAIEATNESGLFAYLRQLDVEDIILNLSQDDKQFNAIFTSEAKTENRAKTIVSGLNSAIMIGKMQVKDESSKLFLESSNITSEGKNFSIKVSVPSDKFQEIINSEINKLPKNE